MLRWHRQWLSRLPNCHRRYPSCSAENTPAVAVASRPASVAAASRGHSRRRHRLHDGWRGGSFVVANYDLIVARTHSSSSPERGRTGNNFGHNYRRVGGPVDPSTCALTEDEIHGLIRERTRSRRARDFEAADGILSRLSKSGVDLDDKSKQWRADAPNAFGHGFAHVGGPVDPSVCALSEGRIHELLRERTRRQVARDFGGADGIRNELRRSGVKVDDKSKQWRADGVLADGTRMGSSPAVATVDGSLATGDPTGDARATNEHGHVYAQVGARMDTSLPPAKIHDLLRGRMLRKRARDFRGADAILEELRRAGVEVDDGAGEWRADVLNRHGHDFSYVGAPFDSIDCVLSGDEIHGLLRERLRCKRARDFERADAIQDELTGAGVAVDDKTKLWTTFRLGNREPSSGRDDTTTRISSPGGGASKVSSRSANGPKMKDCETIERAIELMMGGLEHMTTRRISAFWAAAPRLLDEWIGRPAHEEMPASNRIGKILALTVGNIGSFSPRELSTTALGLARVAKKVGAARRGKEWPEGSPHQKLQKILLDPETRRHVFRGIANASAAVLPAFDARSVANLSYAYAVADLSPELDGGGALFDRLAEKTIPMLGSFKGQELSNALWAYARLGASHPDLFREAGDKIVSLDDLRIFTEQALSNVVWSYATLEERHPELFRKVADHVASLDDLDKFRAQALSNILWAYASSDEAHVMLFERVADHIVSMDDLSGFSAQHLSNIPWAYATAKEPRPRLFEKIAEAAIDRQDEFTSQGVSNLLWAYASNGQQDQRLFASLSPSVESFLTVCNGQELGNVAWAYAVADVPAPSVFDDAFVNACLAKEDEFSIESLSQLHQWQLWQEELKSGVELPLPLREKCHGAFVSRDPVRSRSQGHVVSELTSIGLRPTEEQLTERGYRLDALAEVNGKTIGIEFDGPSHFVGRKPRGGTILKRRQVANLEGIRVASIPYWEWDELGGDSGKKQIYLRLLLGLF